MGESSSLLEDPDRLLSFFRDLRQRCGEAESFSPDSFCFFPGDDNFTEETGEF